jgi:hypothetical protein
MASRQIGRGRFTQKPVYDKNIISDARLFSAAKQPQSQTITFSEVTTNLSIILALLYLRILSCIIMNLLNAGKRGAEVRGETRAV